MHYTASDCKDRQAVGDSMQAAFDQALREGFLPTTITEPDGRARDLIGERVRRPDGYCPTLFDQLWHDSKETSND